MRVYDVIRPPPQFHPPRCPADVTASAACGFSEILIRPECVTSRKRGKLSDGMRADGQRCVCEPSYSVMVARNFPVASPTVWNESYQNTCVLTRTEDGFVTCLCGPFVRGAFENTGLKGTL